MRELPEFRQHGFDKKFLPLPSITNIQPSASGKLLLDFAAALYPAPLTAARVLDLGCGRGELVAALRQMGVQAHGIEIDQRFVDSGRALNDAFSDPYAVLSTVDRTGRSTFPNGYFDVILSDQVLEHVENLKLVTQEVARLLRPGGITLHQFPGRFRIVEPHYKLPFAHWLPKGPPRRLAIKALLAAGLSGEFFPDYDLAERTEILFKYSVEQTFYRPVAEVGKAFRAAGLTVNFPADMRAYVEGRTGRAIPSLLPLAEAIALFRQVMFVARKPN